MNWNTCGGFLETEAMSDTLCRQCQTPIREGGACSRCLLETGLGAESQTAAERLFQIALSYHESERPDFVRTAAAANPEKQLNYRLARLLSRRTDSLLLTTATPHNGRRETFGRLITLLDWSAIPDPKLREFATRTQ